jgi:hypothetical protein
MENQTPSKPVKAKQTRLQPKPAEISEEEMEANPNKYAKRVKIGRPTLGRSANFVESFGLNNLRVLTANGQHPDLRPE